MNRTCGRCTACCTVAAVAPLRKPAGVRCEYECARGCTIYEYRPEPCVTYRCAWLEGEGHDSERPDAVGAVVELARRLDGSPALAVAFPTPGSGVGLVARLWMERGVPVLTPSGILATRDQARELRHVQMRFADGEVVEFSTEAMP